MEAILDFLRQTGFYLLGSDPKVLIMIAIACVLLYLAIKKGLSRCCFCRLLSACC